MVFQVINRLTQQPVLGQPKLILYAWAWGVMGIGFNTTAPAVKLMDHPPLLGFGECLETLIDPFDRRQINGVHPHRFQGCDQSRVVHMGWAVVGRHPRAFKERVHPPHRSQRLGKHGQRLTQRRLDQPHRKPQPTPLGVHHHPADAAQFLVNHSCALAEIFDLTIAVTQHPIP